MSSSPGSEFEADFSIDLFADIAPLSILQLPESEGIAMNLTADQTLVPSSETQSDTSTSSSDSEETIQDVNDSLDYEAFDDLCSLYSDDEGPLEVIIASHDSIFDMRLIVIVSMVSSFPDRAETLIHAGDFLIKVTPTTTIREIKYGITSAFEICYEDMALVFVGKFLSDSRTIQYYLINDGQTLHLLVEAPNKLFKDVFEAFKTLNLNEEKAWFATKSFIHLLHNKPSARNEFENDQTRALTDERLLHEIERLCVPDSDESDDSSADEDEPNFLYSHVVTVGGTELVFENEVVEEENSEDEEENSMYEEYDDSISEYEGYNSEYDDNTSGYEGYNSEDDEGNDEMEEVE